jgi:hypothetical protein
MVVKKFKAAANIRYLICFFMVFSCSLVIFYQWGGELFWMALMPVLFIVSWGTAISLSIYRSEIEGP